MKTYKEYISQRVKRSCITLCKLLWIACVSFHGYLCVAFIDRFNYVSSSCATTIHPNHFVFYNESSSSMGVIFSVKVELGVILYRIVICEKEKIDTVFILIYFICFIIQILP